MMARLAESIITVVDNNKPEVDPMVYVKDRYENTKTNAKDYELGRFVSGSFISGYGFVRIDLNTDSGLLNEWQAELDSAQGLIDECVKMFDDRSTVDNSINSEVIRGFIGKDRTGIKTDSGKLYTKECFLVRNNNPEEEVYLILS